MVPIGTAHDCGEANAGKTSRCPLSVEHPDACRDPRGLITTTSRRAVSTHTPQCQRLRHVIQYGRTTSSPDGVSVFAYPVRDPGARRGGCDQPDDWPAQGAQTRFDHPGERPPRPRPPAIDTLINELGVTIRQYTQRKA